MLHILTIHFKDKWVDIQKKQLKKYINEDYKVYTRLGENYNQHKDKFDGAIEGQGHWTESMGLLLKFVNENAKDGDKVLLLDSDAFPIAPISDFLDEKLKEYPFVSCQEPQHEWDTNYKIPHPMFMLFDAKHILQGDLSHYLSNIIKDPSGNWWGGVIEWMNKNKYDYYPIVRSNKTNLHPLYFGIYENLIYHHWAGSRRMITRADRLKHKREGGDGYNGPGIERIAEENHKMSNDIFEQITHQCETIMSYLMGNYTDEVE